MFQTIVSVMFSHVSVLSMDACVCTSACVRERGGRKNNTEGFIHYTLKTNNQC